MIVKMAEVSAPCLYSLLVLCRAVMVSDRLGLCPPGGAVHTTLLTSLEVSLLLYECSSRVFGSFSEMAPRLYKNSDLLYKSNRSEGGRGQVLSGPGVI